MSQCSWISDGDQCEFPGTMSEGLKGDGRWLCPHHFRADRVTGAEIVERSKRWAALPNRAEAWVEARRKQVYGKGDNPMVARLRAQLDAAKAGRQVGIASSRLRLSGEDEREDVIEEVPA